MKVHSRDVKTRPLLSEKYKLIKRWKNRTGISLAEDALSLDPYCDTNCRQYYIVHPTYKKRLIAAAYVCFNKGNTWELCTIGSNVKGGGTAILNAIVKDMKKFKISQLVLYSLEEACGFYEKYGFEKTHHAYSYKLIINKLKGK